MLCMSYEIQSDVNFSNLLRSIRNLCVTEVLMAAHVQIHSDKFVE